MSRNLTSFVFRDWQSRKFVKVSTGLTNFVSTFLRKKKFPSQSSLAHKLMCSGFFYLPKVSEKLPQPGCISIRLMYSGFFYLPPFKMIFNIKERKKAKRNCQQHPVFPGGHPSKYWLGSTLLNFSVRSLKLSSIEPSQYLDGWPPVVIFRVPSSIPRPGIFKNLPFNLGFQAMFIFNI